MMVREEKAWTGWKREGKDEGDSELERERVCERETEGG